MPDRQKRRSLIEYISDLLFCSDLFPLKSVEIDRATSARVGSEELYPNLGDLIRVIRWQGEPDFVPCAGGQRDRVGEMPGVGGIGNKNLGIDQRIGVVNVQVSADELPTFRRRGHAAAVDRDVWCVIHAVIRKREC